MTSVHDVVVAVEPAGARRRVGRDRREHAPRPRAEHRAALAGRGHGGRRAPARRRSAPRWRRSPATASIMAAAISEHGQDLTRPATTATRTAAPAGGSTAARRSARCRRPPPSCTPRSRSPTTTASSATATSQVPAERRRRRDPRRLGRARHARLGQPLGDVHGRRACRARALRGGFPAGDADGYMERNLIAGLFHASASLGIAEAAAAAAAGRARQARGAGRAHAHRWSPRTRSSSAPAGRRSRVPRRSSTSPRATSCRLFAETQAAKAFVNEAAARIVDRALALSGGAGLPQRPPARARVPRRPRRQLHAPARRQPRVRPARRCRARPRACSPLSRRAHPARRRSGASATGVAFVTAEVDGTPLGLIVSSFAAVSLRPPLVSFCPARDSLTWRRMRHGDHFAVNVLEARPRRVRAPCRGAGSRSLRGARCATRSRSSIAASRPSTRPATTRSSSAACARARPPSADPLVYFAGGVRRLLTPSQEIPCLHS